MCECLLFNLFITFFTAYFNINHTKNILLLSRNLTVKVFWRERNTYIEKSCTIIALCLEVSSRAVSRVRMEGQGSHVIPMN